MAVDTIDEPDPETLSDNMGDSSSDEYLETRISKLGFKPQKEIIFNKFLPYSESIDDEALEMLKDIKGNLGKCVLLKETNPGCLIWVVRLTRYIQMFGYKFSKEDHITFIKLLFDIITIPNLDTALLFKCSVCLIELLKKKHLISREELVLPWKPLYDLAEYLSNKSNSKFGMYKYSQKGAQDLTNLINCANIYFSESSTQEMLDLWRPELCPLSPLDMASRIDCFETFLPTVMLPHETGLGYELWFNEFMDIWKTCNNAASWERNMMDLMARVAHDNIGLIDWEPYFPFMFTNFLRNFSLPVNYKKRRVNKKHNLSRHSISIWIVSTLGGGSSCQKYLTRLIKVFESYLHPANNGVWVIGLQKLLKKLPCSFIQRLTRERFPRPTWISKIPPESLLTEDDITQFVESLAPIVTLAMYSNIHTEVTGALQDLAVLRPSIVIPPVIEGMYNSLNSLTEPHKYAAAMTSLIAVARPMVEPNDYKEGPTHVIPLLQAVLPGIDPNDIRKCFITFQIISSFVSMIPLIDSSNASAYWNDLTEEEDVICAATSEFEDFVLQFLDKCFSLVDTSVLENTRMEATGVNKQERSHMEHIAEKAIESTISVVLCQTSPQIFKSALHKLHTFVTSRILETTVSGRCIGAICKTFAKVRPAETLKLFIPHFCHVILSHLETEEVKEEETLDNELLYNLLLLGEISRCYDKALLVYSELLENVLDQTLHLKCREGYFIASSILGNLMHSLSVTRPKETRSSNQDFGQHISKYLSVREWGKAHKVSDVKVEWQVPGETEISYIQHLLGKYLVPELDVLSQYSNGTQDLSRDRLRCSLNIVMTSLLCGRLLPLWDDEPIIYHPESCSEKAHVFLRCSYPGKVTMPDGKNVRKTVFSVMAKLQDKLLASAEDDVNSLILIVSILDSIVMSMIPDFQEFKVQEHALYVGKKMFENRLLGKTRHLRQIIVNQIYHHHDTLLMMASRLTTQTHADILHRLLELSISHYSEVRRLAQTKLNSALGMYSINNTGLDTKIISILNEDSNLNHEKFKGVLFVLLGPKRRPLVIQKYWPFIRRVWTSLVQTQPSEKPSIIALLNSISDIVVKSFYTFRINAKFGTIGEENARALWKGSLPIPDLMEPTVEDMKRAVEREAQDIENNKEEYFQLLESLVSSINSNIHWRHHFIALEFIRCLVHPDYNYTPQVARTILNTLIHDSIEFRKIAIRCTVFLLKQQKKAHKYRTLEVDRNQTGPGKYGDREDNRWLQYNKSSAPQSAEEWDQPRFNHNVCVGYYTWPQEVKVNGLSGDQPPLDRNQDQMNPCEIEIDNFFSDPNKIDKLISYFSLEEVKGSDKFSTIRFFLFKSLFQSYGDKHFHLFKPHLEKLVADKHESCQRCAAEIMTGMIRGSKHWPYEKVENMWQFLIPLLKTAYSNMTVETVHDWNVLAATAVANRNPNRHHWLLELLMDDPLREEASFIDCGRLSALQGALNQQGWRVAELYTRLLEYLSPKLSHPYQLLRERIGSVLTNVFASDLPTVGMKRTIGPNVNEFVANILPQLQCLYYLTDSQNGICPASTEAKSGLLEVNGCQVNGVTGLVDDDTKNTAICLFKTMIKWLTNSIVRANYSIAPEFFKFLPLVCLMENYEADEELKLVCTCLLAALAQSFVLPEFMQTALTTVNEVCRMSSWSARATCLDFFQVLVFHNMAIVSSHDAWVNQVNSLVLCLLRDERVEVRVKAGQMLSGLIHCCFISDTQQLMDDLKQLLKTTKKKKKTEMSEIPKLHSGILGLCAFISANPYDVEDPVPEIFLLLSDHLNDPEPIPSSIRKTLGDFKRTHHNNWEQHKLKFTEDQLYVLTDMVAPPSHYA